MADFQQTGTSASAPFTGCSGPSNTYWAANTDNYVAQEGGTSGSNLAQTVQSGATQAIIWIWKLLPATSTPFAYIPGGTWTVRLNVVVANMNLTWTDCYVCTWQSPLATARNLGSATGLAKSLGSTGVQSTTVTVTGTRFAEGDALLVTLYGTNGAMSNQSVTLGRDQAISTTIVDATSAPQPTAVNFQDPAVMAQRQEFEKRNWLWRPRRPSLWKPELWLPGPAVA